MPNQQLGICRRAGYATGKQHAMDVHTAVQEPHEAETSVNACEQQHLVNADLCSLAEHGQPYCLTARVFQKPLYHPQRGCSPDQEIHLVIVPYRL